MAARKKPPPSMLLFAEPAVRERAAQEVELKRQRAARRKARKAAQAAKQTGLFAKPKPPRTAAMPERAPGEPGDFLVWVKEPWQDRYQSVGVFASAEGARSAAKAQRQANPDRSVQVRQAEFGAPDAPKKKGKAEVKWGTTKHNGGTAGIDYSSTTAGYRYFAMTLSDSKTFKTLGGAVRWLERRGYNPDGTRAKKPEEPKVKAPPEAEITHTLYEVRGNIEPRRLGNVFSSGWTPLSELDVEPLLVATTTHPKTLRGTRIKQIGTATMAEVEARQVKAKPQPAAIKWEKQGRGRYFGIKRRPGPPMSGTLLSWSFSVDHDAAAGMWRVQFGGPNEPPQHFIGARSTLKRAKKLAEEFDGDLESEAVKDEQRRDKERGTYAGKKERKAERLRERAERKRGEASSLRETNVKLGEVMAGTPILVGHHSERRHRRDLDKMHKRDEKAYQLHKEAASLERRAASAEASRAIDSDDPDAIEKLKAKHESITAAADQMVEINKIVGRKKRELTAEENQAARERLAAAGISDAIIDKVMTPDYMGRIGFPSYAINNSRAEARRVMKRIGELGQRRSGEQEIVGSVRIVEEENRVRIFFPDKPSDATRKDLKGSGFRWSRRVGAWQRKPSSGAWYHARRLAHVYEQHDKKSNPHRYHVLSRQGVFKFTDKAEAMKSAELLSKEDQGPGGSVAVIDAETDARLGDFFGGKLGYFTSTGSFRVTGKPRAVKPPKKRQPRGLVGPLDIDASRLSEDWIELVKPASRAAREAPDTVRRSGGKWYIVSGTGVWGKTAFASSKAALKAAKGVKVIRFDGSEHPPLAPPAPPEPKLPAAAKLKLARTLRGLGRQYERARKKALDAANKYGTGSKLYQRHTEERNAIEDAYERLVRAKLAERPPRPVPKTARAVREALKRESRKLDELQAEGEHLHSGSMEYHRHFERLSQLEEAEMGHKLRTAARKGLL